METLTPEHDAQARACKPTVHDGAIPSTDDPTSEQAYGRGRPS